MNKFFDYLETDLPDCIIRELLSYIRRFAAALAGSYLAGRSLFDAVRTAADFTSLCIRNTMEDPDHWYGVKFEQALPELIEAINK